MLRLESNALIRRRMAMAPVVCKPKNSSSPCPRSVAARRRPEGGGGPRARTDPAKRSRHLLVLHPLSLRPLPRRKLRDRVAPLASQPLGCCHLLGERLLREHPLDVLAQRLLEEGGCHDE